VYLKIRFKNKIFIQKIKKKYKKISDKKNSQVKLAEENSWEKTGHRMK